MVTNKVFCDQTQNKHTKHKTDLERNLLQQMEKLF